MPENTKEKKPGKNFARKTLKALLIIVCVLAALSLAWIALSMIGRVDAAEVIPSSSVLRVSVPNTLRVIDGIMEHESACDISAVPALSAAAPFLKMLNDTPVLKNRFARLLLRGKLEAALHSGFTGQDFQKPVFSAAFDMGFFSPLLRLAPAVSGFIKIPGLYYISAGKDSRFEYRVNDEAALYIGRYRNLLFVSNNSGVFESRAAGEKAVFSHVNPSEYDAVFSISSGFIGSLLAGQDPKIAMILGNIEFSSDHPAGAFAEAGVLISSRKLEFNIVSPLSSGKPVLSRFINQRSGSPYMAERVPASARYATLLSAGTLEELYQAAVLFSGPELENTLRQADAVSSRLLGLTINDLLFSWSGKEFAVFTMEGRPHPVFAIQIADERKRQAVFNKAFSSIVLNEDLRLNIDGARIPRISVPEFLQSLLRRWNVFLPSPYYTVYDDIFLASESAEALLSSLRAMQRSDVLPKTDAWREITGGKPSASAFSLYYSLDVSVPFFLRKNTALSAFLSLYRQGFVRLSFDKGLVGLSLSLVPGSGNGVTLVNGYPMDIGARLSKDVYGAGGKDNSRVFFASGGSAFSVNPEDKSIYEIDGQGSQWIVPAGEKDTSAWVVSDRGRVTLVDGNLEALKGFPVVTGLRLSSPPVVFGGRVYLCDEDGKVSFVGKDGKTNVWETSFQSAVRSPPSFLTVSSKNTVSSRSVTREYAAVYPKSFFGEIWLLDANGKTLPDWPAPVYPASGIGFGSPSLFEHDGRARAAFVCQTGELSVYDDAAAAVPPFPIEIEGVFYRQPVFDGTYLWLVSANGTLYRVSLEGEVLSHQIAGFSVMEEGHLTIFDCDGDKIPEIFITGEGNALYAFTRSFRSLEGFPLPVWGKPLFVEERNSGSGKAEIFGIGMDRRLYRWRFR